jgi:hypothetical protein
MRIYLATALEDGERESKAGVTMTRVGYIERLISYFILKNLKIKYIKEYTATGIFKKK